uniref:RNase H type-1 domain-containing protein n=1 Tax=Oryza brachyantha TaxID=4533 RepID=J3MC85_ORYBR
MDVDLRCVMCGRFNEDAGHLISKCKTVKKVWQELNLKVLRAKLEQQLSGKNALQTIYRSPEAEQMKAILCLWHWWRERNGVREGGKPRNPADLSYLIMSQAGELIRLNKEDPPVKIRGRVHWKRPAHDNLKINIDGAYRSITQGGWGFVIRDRSGAVIQARAGAAVHLMDAFHAEVLACAEAIRSASERGMSRIELETNSMMLRQALQDNSFNLSALGGVILEIKHEISMCFHSFCVNYCRRDCNK